MSHPEDDANRFAEFIDRTLLAIWSEWRKPLGQLLSDLGEAWDEFDPIFGWRTFFIFLPFIGPTFASANFVQFVARVVDAFNEFSQDLALVPYRALADVIEQDIPMPSHARARVVRADVAARVMIAEQLRTGIQVLDFDVPAAFAGLKKVKILFSIETALRQTGWIARLSSFFRINIPGLIVTVGAAVIRISVGFAMILNAGIIFLRIWQEGNPPIGQATLSQDSRRVRTRRRRTQHRLNLREGPDK